VFGKNPGGDLQIFNKNEIFF
jgi:hypothetical protein